VNFVLIDSCAWIDFLRYQQDELGNTVSILIKNDEVAITGVIVTE
jgi:hypothetical protein